MTSLGASFESCPAGANVRCRIGPLTFPVLEGRLFFTHADPGAPDAAIVRFDFSRYGLGMKMDVPLLSLSGSWLGPAS